MRIRIVHHPPVEGIDGIRLDCFEVGQVYEVGTTIGALFMAEGWAEPLPLDEMPPPVPFSAGDPFTTRVIVRRDPPNLTKERASPFWDRALAADASRRRRRR